MSNARNIAALSTVEVGATADQTKADLNAIGVSGGRKNLIMNGGFDVWQRGTSYSGGSGAYTADRWITIGSGLRDTIKASSTIGGAFVSTFKMTATDTLSYIGVQQKVEATYDYSATVTPTYIASAWVKSNTIAQLRHYDGASNVYSTPHSGGGAWEKLTLLISGRTATSATENTLAVDSYNTVTVVGDYIEFTQVQLELGSVATDFEHRSYGEELALCQRYYWQGKLSNGQGTRYAYGTAGAGKGAGSVTFPVTMRADPTISAVTAANYNNCSHDTYSYSSISGFSHGVTVTVAGSYRAYWGVYQADAEL